MRRMAKSAAPDPHTLLPLTPAVFSILLALAGSEKHGYAIMKEAALPEGGGVSMGPGTLYGSLDRMMRSGLVEETGATFVDGGIIGGPPDSASKSFVWSRRAWRA